MGGLLRYQGSGRKETVGLGGGEENRGKCVGRGFQYGKDASVLRAVGKVERCEELQAV